MIQLPRPQRLLGFFKNLNMSFCVLVAVTLLSVCYVEIGTKAVSLPSQEPEDASLSQEEPSSASLHSATGSVTLLRAFLVTVTDNGTCYQLETTGGCVSDALREAGIELNRDDLVNVALDACLTENMAIAVTRVGYETEVKEVSIPFDTTTVYSDALPEGEVVTTPGVTGIKAITYSYKFVNGQVVSTEIVDETITKDAVSAVRTVGTKKTESASRIMTYGDIPNRCVSTLTPAFDLELDENGIPLHYTKKITGKGSAYTWTGNRTCTGKIPQPGYIAVNKNVIPLHTKLFIRCSDGSYLYGYAEAEDTGGFAQTTNRIVDLYFSTYHECVQFGVRNVDVYVLE